MKIQVRRKRAGIIYQPSVNKIDEDGNGIAELEDGRLIQVNPGTQPVLDATEDQAKVNMVQFLTDSHVTRKSHLGLFRRPDQDYGNGRFAFEVCHPEYSVGVIVQMPGAPLDKVRYMMIRGQNIWNFPRLYVNDLSLVWCHGLLRDSDFTDD